MDELHESKEVAAAIDRYIRQEEHDSISKEAHAVPKMATFNYERYQHIYSSNTTSDTNNTNDNTTNDNTTNDTNNTTNNTTSNTNNDTTSNTTNNTNDNVYIGRNLASINDASKIHSRKRILSSTFRRLKEKMMMVTEEDRAVKKFYQRIITPMKLQKGFDALYALWDRKNVFEADPRYVTITIIISITITITITNTINITITITITIILTIRIRLHDHNLIETYLYQWRDNYYYEKGLRDKANSHMSIRGIVNEMSAVNIWRAFTTEMHHYHTCYRRADTFRKMVSSSSLSSSLSSSSSLSTSSL